MPEGIHEAAPIASALVIGIGGSGVQTLARLRSAVRDRNRPGQVAMDNVKFLAIDSVEQNDQIPALPPGTGLSKDEFYNIARDAMNANRYVKTAWRNDAILRESWDVDYRPPNESLTQGMKRSRPLGNLVFRTQSSRVQDAIRTSLNQVLSLAPEQMAGGRVMYPATPDYFADYTRAFVEAGVNLIACQMTVDLFGYAHADFIPEVKEYCGAATFLPMARDADVSLFI